MNRQKETTRKRMRRHRRVRRRVRGTAARPRLSVFRSLANTYVQVIDDTSGRTLVAASTVTPDLRQQIAYGGNVAAAKAVGARIAELARDKGIQRVCFDRGGYRYHGRVKAVAEAAREGGLEL